MKRQVILCVVACGLLAAYAEDIGVTRADNGDITVAPGGEVTIGPNGSSTNNTQNLTVTFEDGGTIKTIPTDKNKITAAGKRKAMRTPVNTGTSSNQGFITKVFCSPSANEAACSLLSVECIRLTTRNIIKVMTNEGTVVISI